MIESTMKHKRSGQTGQEKKNMLNVYRENVVEGAETCFKRKSFDPALKLSVQFGDEDGIDHGGPTREFMRLAMKQSLAEPIWTQTSTGHMMKLNSACKFSQFKKL